MKLFLKSGLNTENKQFRDSHCKRFLGCCVLCTRYGCSWCTSDGPFYRDVWGTKHSDVLMEADQQVLSVQLCSQDVPVPPWRPSALLGDSEASVVCDLQLAAAQVTQETADETSACGFSLWDGSVSI